jgi:tripartite-type tricarboxylate transporter receptor subunit TctC
VLYPLIQEGKVRPLAVARPARWPMLPEVPTLVESGYPDFIYDAWTGVVAPKGTPAMIVAKLNGVINEGLRSPEMTANLAKFSAIAQLGTPQEFSTFLADEIQKWAAIVKVTGATAE